MELIKRNRSGYPADLRDAGPVDFPARLRVSIADGRVEEAREEEAQVHTVTEQPKAEAGKKPIYDYVVTKVYALEPKLSGGQTDKMTEQTRQKRACDYADQILEMSAQGMRPWAIAAELGLPGKQVANLLYRKRQQAKLAEVRKAPRQTAPQGTGQVFCTAPIQTYTPPTQDAPSSLAAAVVTEADRCAQVLQAVERAYGDGGRDVAVAALLRLQQAVDRLMREVA